jgi:hypothetical protein
VSELKRKCEHCEEQVASRYYLGFWLCDDCNASLIAVERERQIEEAEKLRVLVEGRVVVPSIVSDLYINAVKRRLQLIFITNPDKCADYEDSHIAPLVHRMSDDELSAFAKAREKEYFLLKNALEIRRHSREEEAALVKRSTKRERTREKATREIEKQKKHAPRDKTLAVEERKRAAMIESLVKCGMSEKDAIATYEKAKGLKK